MTSTTITYNNNDNDDNGDGCVIRAPKVVPKLVFAESKKVVTYRTKFCNLSSQSFSSSFSSEAYKSMFASYRGDLS